MTGMDINRYARGLRTHLKTLNSFSKSFDQGHYDTAFIMANSLRFIFKDSERITSPLKLLGADDVRILSTVEPKSDFSGVLSYEGILQIKSGKNIGFIAPLDQARYKEFVQVKDWYEQVVSKHEGHSYSRQRIILCVTEKDSGTHVDRTLPADYEKLKSGFWQTDVEKTGEKSAISDLQLLMIRQMVYEVVNSPDIGRLATL
jgi:hypothetical protein